MISCRVDRTANAITSNCSKCTFRERCSVFSHAKMHRRGLCHQLHGEAMAAPRGISMLTSPDDMCSREKRAALIYLARLVRGSSPQQHSGRARTTASAQRMRPRANNDPQAGRRALPSLQHRVLRKRREPLSIAAQRAEPIPARDGRIQGADRKYSLATGFPFPLGPLTKRKTLRSEVRCSGVTAKGMKVV